MAVRILTPDLKGVSYLAAHQHLFTDARFHYHDHITFGFLDKNIHISVDKTPIVDPEVGVNASIRIVNQQTVTRDKLLDSSSATEEMLAFLTACIRYGVSVAIAGSTGSGKTTISFLKLTLLDRLPLHVTMRVFHREPMTEDEDRIIRLASQTLLSTAEIIKCVEKGAYDLSTSDKVLEVLYNDDTTTCDNLPSLAKCFDCWQPVTAAVANLYLRKQIIFERI